MVHIKQTTSYGLFKQQVFTPNYAATMDSRFIEPVFDELFVGYHPFDWPSFETELLRPGSLDDPAWFACLNVTLALTTQHRALNTAIPELYNLSWSRFKNAFGVLPQLLVHGRDMWAVKAVLAMAAFIRGTPDTQTLAMLISSAARLYQLVGLDNTRAPDNAEADQQERVFWIMYSLDAEMSLGHGLPPVVGNMDLARKPLASGGRDDTAKKILELRAELSTLERGVYTALRSIKSRQTGYQYAQEINQTQDNLGSWPAKAFPEIHIDYANQTVNLAQPDKLEVLRMCLEYLGSEQIFHWAAWKNRHTETIQSYTNQGFQFDGSSSRRRYHTAAHLTMLQLENLSAHPYSSMW